MLSKELEKYLDENPEMYADGSEGATLLWKIQNYLEIQERKGKSSQFSIQTETKQEQLVLELGEMVEECMNKAKLILDNFKTSYVRERVEAMENMIDIAKELLKPKIDSILCPDPIQRGDLWGYEKREPPIDFSQQIKPDKPICVEQKEHISATRFVICPVCLGRGAVPSGFYTGVSSTSAMPETCKACHGKGCIQAD